MVTHTEWPNEPKLSHGPRWRGPCMAGGEGGGPEAGAVTARPVGCNAWLGLFGLHIDIGVVNVYAEGWPLVALIKSEVRAANGSRKNDSVAGGNL